MIRISKYMLGGLALTAASSVALAQGHVISGTITAPRGTSVEGAQVIACSVPYQECKTQVSATANAEGEYTLNLPNRGPFQILAMKDEDGDGNGEYLVIAREGAAIEVPTRGLNLTLWKVGEKQRAAANSNADVPQLAGKWRQASTTTELVIGSKVKQMASSAVGYGTDLGGTFGPGSQTNTVIVTESMPVTVSRKMDLSVTADGSYRWLITKTMPEGKCTKTIKQDKVGRILTDRNKITFATASGTESWSNSCGGGGSVKIGKSHETYDYSRSGNVLNVKGSGGVDWQFRRP